MKVEKLECGKARVHAQKSRLKIPFKNSITAKLRTCSTTGTIRMDPAPASSQSSPTLPARRRTDQSNKHVKQTKTNVRIWNQIRIRIDMDLLDAYSGESIEKRESGRKFTLIQIFVKLLLLSRYRTYLTCARMQRPSFRL
jgi:hypothetical protein